MRTDSNLNITAQGRQKHHEALDRETIELIMLERRDLRLIDRHQLRGRGLSQPARFDLSIDRHRETDLGIEISRIRQAEIRKHIARTRLDLLNAFI